MGKFYRHAWVGAGELCLGLWSFFVAYWTALPIKTGQVQLTTPAGNDFTIEASQLVAVAGLACLAGSWLLAKGIWTLVASKVKALSGWQIIAGIILLLPAGGFTLFLLFAYTFDTISGVFFGFGILFVLYALSISIFMLRGSKTGAWLLTFLAVAAIPFLYMVIRFRLLKP